MVERVKQTVPGNIQWRKECKDFAYNVTDWITEHVKRNESVPIRDCEPVVKNECHNVTLPQFKVITEQKSDRVKVMLPACRYYVRVCTESVKCVTHVLYLYVAGIKR